MRSPFHAAISPSGCQRITIEIIPKLTTYQISFPEFSDFVTDRQIFENNEDSDQTDVQAQPDEYLHLIAILTLEVFLYAQFHFISDNIFVALKFTTFHVHCKGCK